MVVRSDDRVDTLRCRNGLQRLSGDRAKRERQPVLLRHQTGRVGGDRLRGDVAGNAVQLPTTEKPARGLRLADRFHDYPLCGVWLCQCQWGTSLVEVPLVFDPTFGALKTGPANFSRVLPGEKSG